MNKRQRIAILLCWLVIGISLVSRSLIWLRFLAVLTNFVLLIAFRAGKAQRKFQMENKETNDLVLVSKPPKRWRWRKRFAFALLVLAALLFLYYREEDWRGKRAWENYRKEAEARGVVLDWKKFIPPEVPDDQNFAMTPFLWPLYDTKPLDLSGGKKIYKYPTGYSNAINFAKQFVDVADDRVFPKGNLIDLNLLQWRLTDPNWRRNGTNSLTQVARKDSATIIMEYLKQYEPELYELETASMKPYSRFDLDYAAEFPPEIPLPHLTVIKNLVKVVTVRASAKLALLESDSALADLKFAKRISDSITNDPFTISRFVRSSSLDMVVRGIVWEGLVNHQWTDSQLGEIQSEFADVNLLLERNRALSAERAAYGTVVFDYFRKHQAGFLEVIFSGDSEKRPALQSIFAFFPKGWTYLEQISYHKCFDRLEGSISPDFKSVYPAILNQITSPDTSKTTFSEQLFSSHEIFASFLSPPYGKTYFGPAYNQDMISEVLVACAIERNRLAGNPLPDKLETLVPKFLLQIPHDAVDGRDFIYRKTDDTHFLLYSVGWNEVDDGGTVATFSGSSANQDRSKGDWVWPAYPEKPDQ